MSQSNKLAIIVARDNNNVIGNDNKIPWRCSDDLKRFKQLTYGHPCIMGRKTFESLNSPLKGRENIVLTTNRNFINKDITVFYDVTSIIEYVKIRKYELTYVIGGMNIYNLFLPYVDTIELTQIYGQHQGDVKWDWQPNNMWKLVDKIVNEQCTFLTYSKISKDQNEFS